MHSRVRTCAAKPATQRNTNVAVPLPSLNSGAQSTRMIVRNSATGQCKTCGADLSKAPGTCDREGRVLGGLAAIPGFGWWPIKAYRPCPGLSSAGVDYVRKGQPTNEMLFGGVSLSESQRESLGVMKETADKGIDIEL